MLRCQSQFADFIPRQTYRWVAIKSIRSAEVSCVELKVCAKQAAFHFCSSGVLSGTNLKGWWYDKLTLISHSKWLRVASSMRTLIFRRIYYIWKEHAEMLTIKFRDLSNQRVWCFYKLLDKSSFLKMNWLDWFFCHYYLTWYQIILRNFKSK